MSTIKDFSGNKFGTAEPVNVCKMKCEMSLNETDIVKIKKSNSKGFTVHSNLFTIKHGNQIYNLNNNNHYITNGIVH